MRLEVAEEIEDEDVMTVAESQREEKRAVEDDLEKQEQAALAFPASGSGEAHGGEEGV